MEVLRPCLSRGYRQPICACGDRRAVSRHPPRTRRGARGSRPLGARLVLQSALAAEVTEFLELRPAAPTSTRPTRTADLTTTSTSMAAWGAVDRPREEGVRLQDPKDHGVVELVQDDVAVFTSQRGGEYRLGATRRSQVGDICR